MTSSSVPKVRVLLFFWDVFLRSRKDLKSEDLSVQCLSFAYQLEVLTVFDAHYRMVDCKCFPGEGLELTELDSLACT